MSLKAPTNLQADAADRVLHSYDLFFLLLVRVYPGG